MTAQAGNARETDTPSALASIIIPCFRVEQLTERCVSECARLFPTAEIIVVPDIADGVDTIAGSARILVSGPATIARKRNLAAHESHTLYLAFIDSDAYPAPGWLDNAVRYLADDEWLAAVGGPNIPPPDQSGSRRLVGFALKSVFVSGASNYRKQVKPARHVNDLPSCNLVVRRAEYLALGGMNESLFTGEDMDFCVRLTASGRLILYTPDVLVFHRNRDLKGFIRQRITYGTSVPRLLSKRLHANFVVLALPALFLLFLLTAPLALLWPAWGWIYGGTLVGYLIALAIESVRQTSELADAPGTFIALLIGNLAPGVGTFAELFGVTLNLSEIYRNDR